MERERFTRIEPNKNRFLLGAFPEEAEALRGEWSENLKELLGEGRGGLLDQLVRAPRFRTAAPGEFCMPEDADLDWVRCNADEMAIEVNPVTRSVQFHSKLEDGERGSFGPYNPDRVPQRWRHLLTREMVIMSPLASPPSPVGGKPQ